MTRGRKKAVAAIASLLSPVAAALVFLSVPRYETVVCLDSSDLDRLPPDTGGEHVGYTARDWAEAFNGFYIYLPAGYEKSPIPYPALFFFHGGGEMGDSREDRAVLERVLRLGPPRMIEDGTWNPPVPFIVVSLQGREDTWWQGAGKTIDSILRKYPIDMTRIYWTGLSAGGYMVWQSLAGRGARLNVAAAVPVCGAIGRFDLFAPWYAGNLESFPVWAFHGAGDKAVPLASAREIVKAVNARQPRFPVRFTVFPELAHACWDAVYETDLHEPTDLEYDAFDTDIYAWLLQYRRVRSRILGMPGSE